MRKLFSCALLLASPLCFGTTDDGGMPSDLCQAGLTAADAAATAADLKRLRLTEDIIHRAEGEDRVLLGAVIGLLRKLDDDTLADIARDMIENPAPSDDIKRNPFFNAYSGEVRPQSLVNYAIMKDSLGSRLSPYEIGLLSASLPKHPRANEWLELDEGPGRAKAFKAARDKTKAMIADPDLRVSLVTYFKALLRDDSIPEKAEHLANLMVPNSARDHFSPAGIETTLDRAMRGMASDRNAMTLLMLNAAGGKEVTDLALASGDRPATRTVDLTDQLRMAHYPRSFLRSVAETYLTEKLGLKLNSGAAISVFSTLNFLDPLPLGPKILRANVVAYLTRFVDPIRLRLAPRTSVSTPAVPLDRPVSPYALQITDLFTPPPTGKKSLRRHAPNAPAAVADSSDSIPAIEKHKNLHLFTGLHASPRPIAELDSSKTYEFWYARERKFRLRTIRFGAEALGWMVDNPIPGRQLLNAIHLGETRGKLKGIKMLERRSRRHDGPLFEVKIHGKFRALLVRVDECWQVIKVSHKDNQEHDREWLAPLKE